MPTGFIQHDSANGREEAHALLDRLSVDQVAAVVRLLQAIVEPQVAPSDAPIDDEPVSATELTDIQEMREWFRHNAGMPFEDMLAEIGLTLDPVTGVPKPS